jgi:hypothetical protein
MKNMTSLPILLSVLHFSLSKLFYRLDFAIRNNIHLYGDNPLRTEVYFCHQNQNTKNIGNFTTLLKLHNIGTHLKGIETSFHRWYHYF